MNHEIRMQIHRHRQEIFHRGLAAFHGHLGPYIVLGYRIGRYVRQHFCSDPFQMKAAVFCEGVPPQTCLADGIQIGSGCTLGKRNIEIVVCDEIRCEFACGERKMVIRPRQINFPPGRRQLQPAYREAGRGYVQHARCTALHSRHKLVLGERL